MCTKVIISCLHWVCSCRYYDVISPSAPQVNVDECKTPSPLNETCECEYIPLKGGLDELQITVQDEMDTDKKDIDITEDELYTRIMQEAMSFAPTLNKSDLDLPSVEESPKLSVERRRSLSSPPHPLHRRSYTLATRRDSFDGK